MRRVFAFLTVLFVSFSVFCATWTFSSPYRHIYAYRYQLNSESEDGWTYVNPDVNTVTIDDAKDGDVLYVQLSLNGNTWSPSGMAEYVAPIKEVTSDDVVSQESVEALEGSEPQEESLPDEDIPSSTIPLIADGTTTPSIVGITDERRNRQFEFAFDIDVGADIFYDNSLKVIPYTGLVLDFKNIASPTYWFGFGVRVKGGASYVPVDGNVVNLFSGDNLALSYYGDVNLAFSFIVADSVDLTLALGGGFSFDNSLVPPLFNAGDFTFSPYVDLGASLDRYFGPLFHIGLSYYCKYYFAESFDQGLFNHNVALHLGFTF